MHKSVSKMASVAISTTLKKITELKVVDLKSELKRRNLDTSGIKSVLLARLKQAIESEDADSDSVEAQAPVSTPTRKFGKGRGRKTDSDLDTTTEDDMVSKETEEYESEKDVTDTDDGTRENCKPALCEDNLSQPETTAVPEVEPETEGVVTEADSEPDVADADTDVEPEPEAEADVEQEAEADVEQEAEADAEPQVDDEAEGEPQDDGEAEPEADGEAEPELESDEEMAAEAKDSSKEVEEDHPSVSMQNEDAITLDVDGDDLLDTGKHVKLPDSEADKGNDEPEASAEMGTDDDMKIEDRDGKQDGEAWGEPSENSRDAMKKAEAGDKEKDSGKKGPSSTGVSGQAKSSSRDRDGKAAKDDKVVGSSTSIRSSHNIWVSGLSFNTKAADLKNLFGKYGKVLSAKVLTNARSPGSKCYGLVTMSSSAEVTRCISQLDCTELDGQQIYVECAKNHPFKKESSKNELDDKASTSKSSEKRSATGTKLSNKSQQRKEEQSGEKDKDSSKDTKSGKSDSGASSSVQGSSKRDDRSSGRTKSPGAMVQGDQTKGKSTFFKMRPLRKPRYIDKPFVNMPMQRRPKWLLPPEEMEMIKRKHQLAKDGGFVPFAKIKEQRMRERMDRARRPPDPRRHRELAEHHEQECQERENLSRERHRLEMERQKLERERLEREKLERERIRIEQERRKEAEHMARQQELRRQQEHLRYEQEKRNLKRGRDVEHGRRDNTYWNGNKKIQSDARLNQGGNFERQQNRFSNLNQRQRGRFPQGGVDQSNTFDRRNRFDGEPEAKKSRPAIQREGAGFERYPKNFEPVRRAEPPPPRSALRDTDRRDRDERRPIQLHDRPMGARMSGVSNPRSPRDGGQPWKNNANINANKGELRGPMRIRTERSGRDGPGPVQRGGSSANRGRGSFNDQDGGRGMVMNDQSFSSGRRVVVECHSREQGMRKEWHGASAPQGGGGGGGGGSFSNNRRMTDSRRNMMSQPSGPSSGMSRIVQITSSSVPSRGTTGGFKAFKGTRQF
ncbi:SAFB-like transcription modulator [Syngnathoides biaculeatus]|uniref:SAFB-like transcription modulator n=1 Tax=Syngnathoides biaculeatus TaxID=300417 RepID=UPI002ADE37DD|nr:SAFB-like transcription modulator [Syngnathoides biaculeatus]